MSFMNLSLLLPQYPVCLVCLIWIMEVGRLVRQINSYKNKTKGNLIKISIGCKIRIFILVFNWNHFEMRLFNLRINFYLLRTFPPHLGSFCVVSSFTTFRPNFTSGLLQVILPRPRIGMLSLVTISPVITAFYSCCLSHHIFDQVNLWPTWVGFETTIF